MAQEAGGEVAGSSIWGCEAVGGGEGGGEGGGGEGGVGSLDSSCTGYLTLVRRRHSQWTPGAGRVLGPLLLASLLPGDVEHGGWDGGGGAQDELEDPRARRAEEVGQAGEGAGHRGADHRQR